MCEYAPFADLSRESRCSRRFLAIGPAVLVLGLIGGDPACAQDEFDLRFDHSSVLVTDLDLGAAFYTNILQLEPLDTPWGPSDPIRFFSLGGERQLHMGLSERPIESDKDVHLAFAVSDFDEYLTFLGGHGVVYGNFAGRSGVAQVRPDGVRQVYFQDPDGNWIEVNDAGS